MRARVANPATTTLAVKLPRAVAARLRESAHLNDRTISGELRRIIRQWAEQQGASDGHA
jgi:hypothetical protein